MILFFIALFALSVYGIQRRTAIDVHFLDRSQTTSVKGIFICLVFICHASGYIDHAGYEYKSIADQLFIFARGIWGQCSVVMFMLYSGYGVLVSLLGGMTQSLHLAWA